jgi:hypothetical protein
MGDVIQSPSGCLKSHIIPNPVSKSYVTTAVDETVEAASELVQTV